MLYIANDTFSNGFQGQIAEIIVYSQSLSAADHQAVVDDLNTKYGLSSDVPEPAGWAPGGSALAAILLLRRRSAA